MSRMIRRQVYLDPTHQRKLALLATRWGCNESEVLHKAIDLLSESEDPIDARLAKSGILVPAPPDRDLPRDRESCQNLERQLDDWAEARSYALGLAEVVAEDRRYWR